jgi:hypothetical protein
MSVRKATRAERRVMVERLLLEDHLRSDRSIARACGGTHSLVGTVRAALVASGRIERRPDRPVVDAQGESGRNANLRRQPAGEPGPALKHGAYSEATLAEIRERHLEELREQFPEADSTILWLQAARIAKLEALVDFFFDRVGGVQGLIDRNGSPRPTTLLMARLEDSIERTLRALSGGGEAPKADPMAALHAHLAEMARARESAPAELGPGDVNGDHHDESEDL